MNRWLFAAVWVVAQCCFFAGWAVFEQIRLAPGRGRSVLVKTVPIDPRDLLAGQYMRLSYAFNRTSGKSFSPNEAVWVVMRPTNHEGQPFCDPVRFSATKPSGATLQAGDFVMRGRSLGSTRASFGVERYYVPEGTETPNLRDTTVRLRVGEDYRPRIETVFVKGKPWP